MNSLKSAMMSSSIGSFCVLSKSISQIVLVMDLEIMAYFVFDFWMAKSLVRTVNASVMLTEEID